MSKALEVVAPGPLATVQDLGRSGFAHLGVPRSGAADRSSLRLANRLVGNPESSACIESTLGGLRLRAVGDVVVAVTGAIVTVSRNGVPCGANAAVGLRDGDELSVGTTTFGLRNYVAVRGGINVAPVLGSRSTDTLSTIGPSPLSVGSRLDVGADAGDWPIVGEAPSDDRIPRIVDIDCDDGPRVDRLADVGALYATEWTVDTSSNRVGVRLNAAGPPVALRTDVGELASEGIAHGSVQVPPSGQPVIFLADHPVTGGYPVVAVVTAAGLDRVGQLTPGQRVRLRRR